MMCQTTSSASTSANPSMSCALKVCVPRSKASRVVVVMTPPVVGNESLSVSEWSSTRIGQCSLIVWGTCLNACTGESSPHGGAGSPHGRLCSVFGVTRFVVDCETLLRIAAGEIEVAAEHQLLAPTLVRSQALSALYEAARRGEISASEGIERVRRINSLKVRFLGDKVLQRQA
jgi:hypothetical protein